MQTKNENRAPNGMPPAMSLSGNVWNPHSGPLPYCMPGNAFGSVQRDDLSQALNSMNINIHGFDANAAGKNGLNGMASGMMPLQVPSQSGGPYYRLGENVIFPNSGNGQQPHPFPQGAGGLGISSQGYYFPLPNFSGSHVMPGSSQPLMWNPVQHQSSDVPELSAPRRNSLSSNEENGPHTPFFGAHNNGDYQPKVAVPDNSPQAFGTPSPQQIGNPFYPQQITKQNEQYVYFDMDAVCQQPPAIPRPIPAIFSGERGRGTLESSLANRNNTTNVYIRGLHPNTTDEMLQAYGARFGTIESAKSMLDQHTGLCKGFGFIKYHNFADGENCIRGFFYWGYEAKWARVSHNEKLKKLGDENNTNLYVSGLPVDGNFNEHSLMSIFPEHTCLSSKILRDTNGLSRGVGFARFESPEECKQIIEQFNGKCVGENGEPISIRFADTADQKKLKMVTQERRQFKTHEYNVAAYGPNSPYQYSPATAYSSPLQPRSPGISGHWGNSGAVGSALFPSYQTVPTPYPSPAVATGTIMRTPGSNGSENTAPFNRLASTRVKLERPPDVRVKIDSPSENIQAALSKRTAGGNSQTPIKIKVEEDESPSKKTLAEIEAKIISPLKSTKSSSNKSSPSKRKLHQT